MGWQEEERRRQEHLQRQNHERSEYAAGKNGRWTGSPENVRGYNERKQSQENHDKYMENLRTGPENFTIKYPKPSTGSGYSPSFSGTSRAAFGIVRKTANFLLGVFGFLLFLGFAEKIHLLMPWNLGLAVVGFFVGQEAIGLTVAFTKAVVQLAVIAFFLALAYQVITHL